VPKEDHHEDDGSKEMCSFEEFIAKGSEKSVAVRRMLHLDCSPNRTPRCKGEPRLEYQSDNAGPVFENIADSDVVNHIMICNVPNNEWKCVHQREDEKSVCDPPMKDLELLMWNPRHQCDPICLA
jgi:hypothetical protein